MCTASIIALAAAPGFRVVMNRDEQRDRAEGLPPRWRTVGSRSMGDDRRALWPTDPKGGGTWIAASDRGLVLALLNLNLDPHAVLAPPLPQGSAVSRGSIIPKLIWSADADAVAAELEELSLDRFAPFRLLAIDAAPTDAAPTNAAPTNDSVAGLAHAPRVIEMRWDRDCLSVRTHREPAACFVSSGLGDALVGDRLTLFESAVAGSPSIVSQDGFHRHTWPDRPHLSVMMSRGAARTVSVTSVEIRPDPSGRAGVRMNYEAVPAPHRDWSRAEHA